jgi:hypothetical protein
MALVPVGDKRYLNRDKPMVSINPKLNRLVIYQKTRELMIEHNDGKEFEHIVLLRDPEELDAFWIKVADSEEPFARKLNATSDTTRTAAISLLLKELDWKGKATERFPAMWDSKNKCIKVDISKRSQ